MKPIVHLVNGDLKTEEAAVLPVNDRGLTLGHGLFETMRLVNGKVPLLDHHWHRLQQGAEVLGIPLPFDLLALTKQIATIVAANGLSDCSVGLRLTLTAGSAPFGLCSEQAHRPHWVLTPFPLPVTTAPLRLAVVAMIKCSDSPLSRLKTLSYLEAVLAQKQAQCLCADEALLLNQHGTVADTATSNLFALIGNTLVTPRIEDGALPGVVRRLLLSEYRSDGVVIESRSLSLAALFAAEAVLVTNALRGIRAVSSIDNHVFAVDSSVVDRLQHWYAQRVAA